MFKISNVKKIDIDRLARIYMVSYNAEWEKWTFYNSQEMIRYRIKKKLKLKAVIDWEIVWFLFSDVKPFYYWNILTDWDLVVDPKYQRKWVWKKLLFYWMDYAQKKLGVKFREFYTFKNSYQYKRYKKLWFWNSERFILMSGNIESIMNNNKT